MILVTVAIFTMDATSKDRSSVLFPTWTHCHAMPSSTFAADVKLSSKSSLLYIIDCRRASFVVFHILLRGLRIFLLQHHQRQQRRLLDEIMARRGKREWMSVWCLSINLLVIFPVLKIRFGPPTADFGSVWSPKKRINFDKLNQTAVRSPHLFGPLSTIEGTNQIVPSVELRGPSCLVPSVLLREPNNLVSSSPLRGPVVWSLQHFGPLISLSCWIFCSPSSLVA